MNRPRSEKPRRNVTAQDVARLAGVSRSAVSRTFTPGASVAKETRRKVLDAAETLGYRVNIIARSLINRRSDMIGLVVYGYDNPFRHHQVNALIGALQQRGFRPLLINAPRQSDTGDLIAQALQYQVAGLIVTSDAPPAEIADRCAKAGIAVILVNKADPQARFDRVCVDNAAGAALAAEALRAAGCRRPGFVGNRAQSYSTEMRQLAFDARLADTGQVSPAMIIPAEATYDGGVAAADALVRSGRIDRLDGLFCCSDYCALGVLDGLRRRHGIAVPERLKIVGFDDIPEAGWLSYDLTTLRQDVAGLAALTLDLLQHRLDTPHGATHDRLLTPHLVRRSSC